MTAQNLQPDIQFVGAVLKAMLDLAGLIPALAEAKSILTVVEDGIQIEEAAYTWFESPQGAAAKANITKLASGLGIKVEFGSNAKVSVLSIRGAEPNDPIWQRTDGNELDHDI